jgi:hypothetical protein
MTIQWMSRKWFVDKELGRISYKEIYSKVFIKTTLCVPPDPIGLLVLLIVSERYGNDRKFLFYKDLQQQSHCGIVTLTQ